MPRFMTVHRAPGLLKEQWAENAPAVYAAKQAIFQQAYVNLGSGFILSIYEAPSRDDLISQFEELGLPHEEIHEIQFSQSRDELADMLKKMGRL